MALEKHDGMDSPLSMVTGRITIEVGFSENGTRGMHCVFQDLSNNPEDDRTEDEKILGYFEGKQMLAIAQDQFLIQHGLLNDPNEIDL